ncbi:MAG: epoxyqueuosine reductase QueH [Bacillota bacterium]|nr:epoxyqueuosine reductase QueH [Bacillota bacterium]
MGSNGKDRPALLLHSCCGPCSTAVVERLAEDYRITLFFYNPNITEAGEYRKRFSAQEQFVKAWRAGGRAPGDRESESELELLEGPWEPEAFYEAVRGLEEEPEGGRRCYECFRLRLGETARKAAAGGYHCFGTTLSVSPHKDWAALCAIGRELEKETGVVFLAEDFKKKAGYQRSVQLSREYGLYRQSFCGCQFSREQKKGVKDNL